MTKALESFVEKKWLSGEAADRIKRRYDDVCKTEMFEEKMKQFSTKTDRLDNLWMDVIPSHDDFDEIRSFLKMVLILSLIHI